MRLVVCLLVWGLRAVFTSRRSLAIENLAVRQQLAACTRTQERPRLKPGERGFWAALSKVWRAHRFHPTHPVGSTSWARPLGGQVCAMCRSELLRSGQSATGAIGTALGGEVTTARRRAPGVPSNSRGVRRVKVVRLPAQSPNLNALAERFVLSVRTECLSWIVPLGEAHLRRAIAEFVGHYHHERNHQGFDNALIAAEGAQNGTGGIVRRERLGGLLSFYCREAA